MDRETMEFEEEEVLSELGMRLFCVQAGIRPHTLVLPSDATLPPRTTWIRSRRSRLARPYPPPASTAVGLRAPGLEGPLAAAAMVVDHDQTPQASHGQGQEPEFEFPMPPPPSVGHGVPSSAGGIVLSSLGGIFLPTRPPTPVPSETASDSARTPALEVKLQSAFWVWTELGWLLVPSDFGTSNTSE